MLQGKAAFLGNVVEVVLEVTTWRMNKHGEGRKGKKGGRTPTERERQGRAGKPSRTEVQDPLTFEPWCCCTPPRGLKGQRPRVANPRGRIPAKTSSKTEPAAQNQRGRGEERENEGEREREKRHAWPPVAETKRYKPASEEART